MNPNVEDGHQPSQASHWAQNFKIRLRSLQTRIDNASLYLKQNNFEDQEALQVHAHHISNALKRVQESLDQAHQFGLSDEDYARAAEKVIVADDLLVDLTLQHKQKEEKLDITIVEPQKKHIEIKVQTFKGERSKYQIFKQAVQLMCERKTATPSEAVLFVTTHLDGKPAKLVENIPLSKEGHSLMWSLLDNEYEDPIRTRNEIFHQLEKIPEAKDNPLEMKETFDAIEALIRVLETQAAEDPINREETYRHLVLSKFPTTLVRYIMRPGEEITLPEARQSIRSVLATEVRRYMLTDAGRKKEENLKQTPSTSKTTNEKRSSEEKTDRPPPRPCPYCTELHWADNCTKYATVEARKSLLKNKCTLCLRADHTNEKCEANRACYYCREKATHHSSLCPKKYEKQEKSKASGTTYAAIAAGSMGTVAKITQKTDSINLATKSEYGTYVTIVATIVNPKSNKGMQLRAIVDPGTSTSYVTDRAADAVDIDTSRKHLRAVKRFGDDQRIHFLSACIEMIIVGHDGFQAKITVNTTPTITDDVPLITPDEFLHEHPDYAHLHFAEVGKHWPIDLLIGNDFAFKFITCQQKIEVGSLQLIHTVFGFVITGHLETNKQEDTNLCSTTTAMEKMTSLEIIGIRDAHRTRSDEENAAIQQFYNNVQMVEGRYEVPLLWKIEPNFTGTFGLAVGRLRSTIKKLTGNREIFEKYDEIICQQLTNGIIEQINSEPPKNKVYYIPHQPVIDMSKTTTPIRIVFDASAKSSRTSPSLNEAIYKGVVQLEDITALLIRFRLHRVALLADIEKAYHMLQLRESDRDYCRFVWVRDITKPMDDDNLVRYRFTRIAFGLTSSQFLLNAVVSQHVKTKAKKFITELSNDFYVDNLLTGTNEEAAAIELHEISTDLFSECKMNLRCWATNSPTVRDKFRENQREPESIVKILGVKWNTQTDHIYLPKTNIDTMKEPTLRIILKQTARIYDPLGWFSPVIIQAKILMQAIRVAGYIWDDKLPINFRESWAEIANDLKNVSNTQFSRYIEPSENMELHAFTDASGKAYGAVIYFKSDRKISLLFAKARVAPTKALSIPKLELLAATIAGRAIKFIEASVRGINITRKVLWTDSKCIIAQVRTTRILPTYVENRVKELRAINDLQMKYVPSSLNIADIASRGIHNSEMPIEWWNGPEFLRDEKKWPEQHKDYDEHLQNDEPKEKTVFLVKEEKKIQPLMLLELERFSTLRKLLDTAKMIVRYLTIKVPATIQRIPQLHEPEKTILRWFIKREQENHYREVLTAMEQQKFHIMVKRFQLFKDEHGIVRCRGRFQRQLIPEEIRYPILLPHPKHSTLTKLIIVQMHRNNYHMGTNHTLAAIRRQYWIPSGRAAVYSVIRKCPQCQRYIARPYKQPREADMPEYRITSNQAIWKNTGMDIWGPTIIERQKTWVFLLTCLSTRAITLEPLESINAEHVELAFRAFRARRSTPQMILSDQGSQFAPIIEVLQFNTEQDIDWKKLPAHSPWMGGVYKRLVGMTKSAFERTFHRTPMTMNMFRVVLLEIENVLNSRPLTYLENEIGIQPLSPNQFLAVPDIYETTNPGPIPCERAFLQALWKFTTNIREQFWNTWASQYLPYLRERHATEQNKFRKRTTMQTPTVGKVVLIAESIAKRKNWSIARITELTGSTDGQIRSALLRLPSGDIVSRPIQDIYPLEIDDEDQQHNQHVNQPDDAEPPNNDQPTATETHEIEIDTNLEW